MLSQAQDNCGHVWAERIKLQVNSPSFLEAQSVPEDTHKTVTDAWKGFHMIPVHPNSRQYTTFVAEQGMVRYLRMPMGDHVSMDAYNYRFDKVMEKVDNLKRCVDDSLIYAKTLEDAFFKMAEYLSLIAQNGILQNPDKFLFGTKKVGWAGFMIGEKSIKLLQKNTETLRSFPTSLNSTEQVVFCYATSPTTKPFRHLLRPSEPWNWADIEGVRLFNPKLLTGLLSDWCGEGMGHFLCQ